MAKGDGNETVGCMAKCMLCCAGCIEKCLGFINKQAYVEVALQSTGYCTSAWASIKLITSNFVRYGTLKGVVDTVTFFGVVAITFGCTAIMGLIMNYSIDQNNDVFETQAPTFMVFMSCLLICIMFTHIYGVSSDTILHCFIYDENKNNGKSQFATARLNGLVNENAPYQKLADKNDQKA